MPFNGEWLVQREHDTIRALGLADGAELYNRTGLGLFRRKLQSDANIVSVRAILERFVLRYVQYADLILSIRPVLERLGVPDDEYVRYAKLVRQHERPTGLRKRRRHMGQRVQLLRDAIPVNFVPIGPVLERLGVRLVHADNHRNLHASAGRHLYRSVKRYICATTDY